MYPIPCKPSKISGNILFILLIAIGLFALLGSVVMDGGGGDMRASKDKAALYATDIISYANSVQNAVQRVLDSGVSESDLCFDIDAASYPGGNDDYETAGCAISTKNMIFHPDGGGVRYQTPNPDYLDNDFSTSFYFGNYIISDNTFVDSLPDYDTDITEIIFFAPGIQKNICIAINNSLGVLSKNVSPPEDDGGLIGGTVSYLYRGNFAYSTTLNVTDDLFDNVPYGCFQQSNSASQYANAYIAFFVLHAR